MAETYEQSQQSRIYRRNLLQARVADQNFDFDEQDFDQGQDFSPSGQLRAAKQQAVARAKQIAKEQVKKVAIKAAKTAATSIARMIAAAAAALIGPKVLLISLVLFVVGFIFYVLGEYGVWATVSEFGWALTGLLDFSIVDFVKSLF